jgi:hypothetical protein
MADKPEQALISALLETLAQFPVTFPEGYQRGPEVAGDRVPVLPVRFICFFGLLLLSEADCG